MIVIFVTCTLVPYHLTAGLSNALTVHYDIGYILHFGELNYTSHILV